jgi:hypothetical protein
MKHNITDLGIPDESELRGIGISLLRPRERLSSTTENEPFIAALQNGIRHALENQLIRHAFLVTALYTFLIRGTLEILPVIADGVFSRGATGLGLLTSSARFSALVAGVTKAFTPSQMTGELPKFALASALLGIGLVPLVGLSNSWILTLLCISYLGFSGTLAGISVQTAIQMDLDDDFRGRVMSLWTMVSIGATDTGVIILGWLADYMGISLALSLAGTLGTVLLTIIVLRARRPSKNKNVERSP